MMRRAKTKAAVVLVLFASGALTVRGVRMAREASDRGGCEFALKKIGPS